MRIDKALTALFDNYHGDNYCIKGKEDVNHGQYCVYKVGDYPLMFARRKDEKIYPLISMNKRIKNLESFSIVEVDKIDEKYIYEEYTQLIENEFIDNY